MGRSCYQQPLFLSLPNIIPSTFQTLCRLLLLSFTITPKVSHLAFFFFFFCLFISLSTPPRSLHANLAPSSVPGILNKFQKLSSQCSIYKPAASLQDHKAVFSSLSLWQSHQLHANMHTWVYA